jgi:hypothetical protein
MPVDNLMSLATGSMASPVTLASGTSINGSAFDLGVGGSGVGTGGAGTRPAGLVCRIVISDAHETSGGGTVTFNLDQSLTGSSNWQFLAGTAGGFADVFTLSATVVSRELFIPFNTRNRFIRLTVVVGTTPVGGTLTYTAFLCPAFP